MTPRFPKCSRCHVRPAVIFMNKEVNGKPVQEGYCIQCAKELDIKPIDSILKQMGLSDDDLENMSSELDSLLPDVSGEDDGDGDENDEGRAPAIDLNAVFNGGEKRPAPRATGDDRRKASGAEQKRKRKCLDAFCIDLTSRAREGKLDRVVGRDAELERVTQILCRRQKNNPCLIGEPGVGKTAVAEALAMRIAEGKVPYKLRDKEVFLVDMTAIVAGTQFRGQFENRMKGLINEVRENGNIILVIDEIHSIVGAGNAEGGMNAANILKPALSRGEVQIIGATTLTENRK